MQVREAISETSRKGKEEMQDGTKEDGARNSETCFATKKFLTEGLGFLARGAEVELQNHTVLLANSNGEPF